jgi:hypothetical protein
MRITAKPYVLPGIKRGMTVIECDDGKAYLGPDLAEKIGLRWPTLRERLRRQNWRRKDILKAEQTHWKIKQQRKSQW